MAGHTVGTLIAFPPSAQQRLNSFLGRQKLQPLLLGWWSSECNGYTNHLEGLLKHSLLDPSPRASDSVVVGGGLRLCLSYTMPGIADAAGLGPLLENHHPGELHICTLSFCILSEGGK